MTSNNIKLPSMGQIKDAMILAHKSLEDSASNERIYEITAEILELTEEQINLETNHEAGPRNKFEDYCRYARHDLGNEGLLHNTVENKWELTDAGLKRFEELYLNNFVENIYDIIDNINYLENIRNKPKNVKNYDEYRMLIENGKTYVSYPTRDGTAFAPSRFIGYKNNRFKIHEICKGKTFDDMRDGKETGNKLSAIFKKCEFVPSLQEEYNKFCSILSINPKHNKKNGQVKCWDYRNLNKTDFDIISKISSTLNLNISDEVKIRSESEVEDQTENKHDEGAERTYAIKPVNLVFYGPPGTSKTFSSKIKAVELCTGQKFEDQSDPAVRDRVSKLYNELSIVGRIGFVTFHQSFSYEEFVEGLRPAVEKNSSAGGFSLEPNDGIFKKICNHAKDRLTTEKLNRDRPIYQIGVNYKNRTDNPIEKCLYDSIIQNEWVPTVNWSDTKAKSLEEFKAEWNEKVDEQSKGYTGGMKQMFDFCTQMKEGDYVVLADGRDRAVAIGVVTGSYYFDKTEFFAPHCRNVDWLWASLEGIAREEIYPPRFHHHATYQLQSDQVHWDKLDQIVYGTDTSDDWLKSFVLIIDEINRANISKVFGELITLLEPSKRIGQDDEILVELPYSRKKFGIPSNLHIIGTMNTADRSIALLDTALRRRFKFEEYVPKTSKFKDVEFEEGKSLHRLLNVINDRVELLLDRDHKIGHSFFIGCDGKESVERIFRDNIIPLLEEYFFEDRNKIAMILGDFKGENKVVDGCFMKSTLLSPKSLRMHETEIENKLQWEIKDHFEFSKLELE